MVNSDFSATKLRGAVLGRFGVFSIVMMQFETTLQFILIKMTQKGLALLCRYCKAIICSTVSLPESIYDCLMA